MNQDTLTEAINVAAVVALINQKFVENSSHSQTWSSNLVKVAKILKNAYAVYKLV